MATDQAGVKIGGILQFGVFAHRVVQVKQVSAQRVDVRDNGKGFDLNRHASGSASKRLGMVGMRERVEMVGGRLVVGPVANIDAQPLLGTLNAPDFRFDNVFRGAPKFTIPPREKSTSLGGDSWETQFDNIHARPTASSGLVRTCCCQRTSRTMRRKRW